MAFLALSLAVHAHPDIELQIAALDERIHAEPCNPEHYLHRGELHRIHGDRVAAEADFRRARELDPGLAAVDYYFGRLALDAGDAEEACRAFDRLLAREPAHVGGLVERARARGLLGQTAAAADDLTRAIEAAWQSGRPDPSYYLDRAQALASTGQLDQAVRGLDDGLARLGEPVTLELYAIELELRRGDTDAALTRITRVAARSRRQETWLVRRGEILEQAGRPEEARQAYSSALRAIEALPPTRRADRAVLALETAAEQALERLAEPRPR